MTCPTCGRPLVEVRYPGGALNREQWASIRAGDWWCETCPDNGRGRSGSYWWTRELTPPRAGSAWVTCGPEVGRQIGAPLRAWLRRPGGRL